MNVSSIYLAPHAIVIGGGIAGLAAARVLQNHFERVTILERDRLPEGPAYRAGVPQARHVHVLLRGGQLALEQLFPGLTEELLAGGAVPINMGSEARWFMLGDWRLRYPSALSILGLSRPLLESTIRQRMRADSRIEMHAGHEVLALVTDEQGRRAAGVRVRVRGSMEAHTLYADLVVDASGRASRAPEWLETLDYPVPRESVVSARPGYASRFYRLPEDPGRDWKVIYVQPVAPTLTRGGIIGAMEEGTWHVTLVGMVGDHPPTDEGGFMAFARSLPTPELYDVLREAEPISPIWGFRQAENRLRHYDELPRYLEHFVVFGDSVYALNPIYGQGMAVAAIASQSLDACLQQRARGGGLDGLAARFQKKLAAGVIAGPWQLATGEDRRWPGTEGADSLDPATRMMQRYLSRVLQASLQDPAVAEAFLEVQQMVKPPTRLFRPDVMWRLRRRRRQRQLTTA